MEKTVRIRLSEIEVSALECRDLVPGAPAGGHLEPEEALLLASLSVATSRSGREIVSLFCSVADAEVIRWELCEASNAEDHQSIELRSEGELELARLTASHARALGRLSGRVLMAADALARAAS